MATPRTLLVLFMAACASAATTPSVGDTTVSSGETTTPAPPSCNEPAAVPNADRFPAQLPASNIALNSIVNYECKEGHSSTGDFGGITVWAIKCSAQGWVLQTGGSATTMPTECIEINVGSMIDVTEDGMRFTVGPNGDFTFKADTEISLLDTVTDLGDLRSDFDGYKAVADAKFGNIDAALGEKATVVKVNELSSSLASVITDVQSLLNAVPTFAAKSTVDTLVSTMPTKVNSDVFEQLKTTVDELRADHDAVANVPETPDMAALKVALEDYTDTITDEIMAKVNKILDCNSKKQFYDKASDSCQDPTGTVQLGASAGACGSGTLGTMKFVDRKLQVCTSGGWMDSHYVPLGSTIANPASSCQHIVDAGDSAGSGRYFLQGQDGAYLAYCAIAGNVGTSKGGDGRTIVSATESCEAVSTFFGLSNEDLFYVTQASGPPQLRVCKDGKDLGGTGTAANPAQDCGVVERFRTKFGSGPYKLQNGQLDQCGDGSVARPARSCMSLTHLGKPSGVYKIGPIGQEIDVYCEMSKSGGGWMMLLTTNLNGNPNGDFGPGHGSPNSGDSDYRIPLNGAALNDWIRAASPSSRGELMVRTASGREQVIDRLVHDFAGFSGACTACNCGGNHIGGSGAEQICWIGGRGGCYGSSHFGISYFCDVHNTCGNNGHWGHFHRGGVNTGVYHFGSTCINENEWAERYIYYARPKM